MHRWIKGPAAWIISYLSAGFFFFFKLASQKHKIIILLWTTDQGHSPFRQHLGFYLLLLFIYFPAYIFSHSFFDCCLVLLFLSSDGSSGELCTVEHIDYFLWWFFLFTLSLSSSQGLKIHLFIICVVTNIHNSNFSFFFLQRLVQVCKTFFN